jgi:hypothetical protein
LVDSEIFEERFLVKYLKNSGGSSKCGELDYVDKKDGFLVLNMAKNKRRFMGYG